MLAAVHGHLKVMQVLLAHTNGHNVDARNHQASANACAKQAITAALHLSSRTKLSWAMTRVKVLVCHYMLDADDCPCFRVKQH